MLIFFKEMIRIDLKEEIVKYICIRQVWFDDSILILFSFVWLLNSLLNSPVPFPQ